MKRELNERQLLKIIGETIIETGGNDKVQRHVLETVKRKLDEAQPQDFYKEMGATYLQYTDAEQVKDAYFSGDIDEYTATQALAYGIDNPIDWDMANGWVEKWNRELYY